MNNQEIRPSFLYIIKNNLNNKLYVGASIHPEHRWSEHKNVARSNSKKLKYHFQNAIAQHLDNIDEVFTLSIIQECPSEKEAYDQEIILISKLRKDGYSLYNETDGGEGGPVMFGANNPFYGQKHSEETIKIISEKNIGLCAGEKNYFFGKSFSGEDHPLFGTKRPQHVKDALSLAHTGKIVSEETRKKQSIAHKGKQLGKDNPMFGEKGELNPNCGIKDEEAIKIYKMYYVDGLKRREIKKIIQVNNNTFNRIIACKDRFVWLKNYNIGE